MTAKRSLISVVDEDQSVRESLRFLLEGTGLRAACVVLTMK
jgi:FixJ family two-component response regulator